METMMKPHLWKGNQWSCLCLGFILKRATSLLTFAHLFGHLGPISNEEANLFGQGSVQNERQTQAPPMGKSEANPESSSTYLATPAAPLSWLGWKHHLLARPAALSPFFNFKCLIPKKLKVFSCSLRTWNSNKPVLFCFRIMPRIFLRYLALLYHSKEHKKSTYSHFFGFFLSPRSRCRSTSCY